jgi:hypothetical protein
MKDVTITLTPDEVTIVLSGLRMVHKSAKVAKDQALLNSPMLPIHQKIEDDSERLYHRIADAAS